MKTYRREVRDPSSSSTCSDEMRKVSVVLNFFIISSNIREFLEHTCHEVEVEVGGEMSRVDGDDRHPGWPQGSAALSVPPVVINRRFHMTLS